MFSPALEEVQEKWSDHHRFFPVALPIQLNHEHWMYTYQQVSQQSTYHALLESGRSGQYSFMAYQPTHVLKGKNQCLDITTLDTAENEVDHTEYHGSVLTNLQTWMKNRRAPRFDGLPDFCGGLLGFFGYDLIREIESLPERSVDDLGLPDLYLLAFEQIIVYDHTMDQHWLLVYQPLVQQSIHKSYLNAQKRLQAWAKEIERLTRTYRGDSFESPFQATLADDAFDKQMRHQEVGTSFSKEQFVQAVKQIQDYIAAGDVFQVNLSVRQSKHLETSPLDVYRHLRRINPSPYMGYLHFPDVQVISASPEQLVKVKGKQINTRPIAGTRPRGENRAEDVRLAKELLNNEKERAEHVMLVDLERNDLGKVCQFGSVHVDQFMVIEEYSHVMHIVSNIRGELMDDQDAFDVICATFPGGTITGAPKIRTMEIIEELEPVRRGLYTGSIGWVDYNGDMELNIIIRTILVQQGKAYIQAGAGIVIDSIPEKEYQESLNKAKALWKAILQSEWSKKSGAHR